MIRLCEILVVTFRLETIRSILSSGDAVAILRFNGGTSDRSTIFVLSNRNANFIRHPGVIGSLCTRPSEESRNFHVNFLFFSWPHVTVRATLARVDDTALAAIDRDG